MASKDSYVEVEVHVRVRDPEKGTVHTQQGSKAKVVGKSGHAFATHDGYFPPDQRDAFADRVAGDALEMLEQRLDDDEG